MSQNAGYQISLDIQGRLCVVIGGDDEASEKVSRLLEGGAKVIVINPTLNAPLKKLAASAKIIHRGRHFRSTDTLDAFLVLNVLREDLDLSKSLFDLAKVEKFLVWSIDQAERSNFMMPAVVERGALRVAISTSGTAPALASTLRQNYETIFDEEFEQFLDWLGNLRESFQKNEPNELQRREQLRDAVKGFSLTGTLTYPVSWKEQKERPES